MDPYMNDKALREGLYMLLLQCSPDKILKDWKSGYTNKHSEAILEGFDRMMPRAHPDRFTEDDAKQLRLVLQEHYFSKDHQGIFACILDFAEQTLTMEKGLPEIRFEQVLRWRDTTHPIGTLPFLAAFLAYEDGKAGRKRNDFAINPVLATDNRQLKYILSKGMAENHFHLNGSAPSFMISWIRLMNNPVYKSKEWKPFEQLQGENLAQMMPDWQNDIYLAAIIRAFLFCMLTDLHSKENTFGGTYAPDGVVRELLEILWGKKLLAETNDNVLSILRSLLRNENLYLQGLSLDIQDYALTVPHIEQDPTRIACMVFAGELRFQYMVFQAIFQKEPAIEPFKNLFYAYLAIQCQLRRELVENDHRFGLGNFCRYDKRKKSFFKGSDPQVQKIIPILDHLCDSRVRSLEARIVPDENESKLKKQITGIDFLVRRTLEKSSVDKDAIDGMLNRLHYVLHFVKVPDHEIKEDTIFLPFRHKEMRDNLRSTVNGILNLREYDRETASRITGIDACSNENYASPEVFAPEFRRMKNHNVRDLSDWKQPLAPLYVTYHVGEDFLDVTDGLRSVWEAVTFIEMGRSSRIGHGLVLGIDVADWYAKKQNRVYLSRQALLDDCVWLLKFLEIYGELESQLRFELLQHIENLFAQIYQNNNRCSDEFSLENYWNAIQLRGDNPEVYQQVEDWKQFIQVLDNQAVLMPYSLRDDLKSSTLYSVRRNQASAVKLYHRYHYDRDVRILGAKSIEFHVSRLMIRGIIQAQKILRTQISQKGIGVEANPSSNVLIGNFNRYEKHPIFTLNDKGLFDRTDTPNILVSINTDDQGIFDTSLENEYALLARALEQAIDSDGKPIVDQDHIYGWLDHVREMGLQQSFFWGDNIAH